MRRKLITAFVLTAIALFPLQGIKASVPAHAEAAMQDMDCECPPQQKDCDRSTNGCMLDAACMLRCSPAATLDALLVLPLAPAGVLFQARVKYDLRPSADISPPFRPPNSSILI